MKNRNIILASIVVVLLAGLAVYQYTQNAKNNAFDDSKKMAQENKNTELKVDESDDDLAKNDVDNVTSSTIYFYGEECPHCKDVLAFFDKNDIYNKVDFVKKEVWHNKKNGEELRTAALKCGLNPSNIGVPFVFSEGKCYMGGPDVMNFFSEKAGLKK